MAKKNASGSGSIRKRQNGTWEGRYTAGHDPVTGKQIQRSVYGKTQAEVRKKLVKISADLDNGTYSAPSRLTVEQWSGIWLKEYTGHLKESSRLLYGGLITNHIVPVLGRVKLQQLSPHTVQSFYNGLNLAPKTVRTVHATLHSILETAVRIGYIPKNPSDFCKLPRVEKKKIHPLEGDQIKALMEAVKGDRFEYLYAVALFTGMRQGELIGLTWDCVDLESGVINVSKQLARISGQVVFQSPKSGKGRTITVAPYVVSLLKAQKRRQAEYQLRAGNLWDNPNDLVFTTEIGGHALHCSITSSFKRIAANIGIPDATFHDLRHTYAVNSIRAGDDIKTIQGNLGHATAAFTLDVYGHVTESMKKESAARQEVFIERILNA